MLKSISDRLSMFNTIINFSHSDMDGIMSSLVVKSWCNAMGKKTIIKLNSYNNIDSNLRNLVLKKNEILVLTDVFPKDSSVLAPFIMNKQVICIDHHESSAEYYNENNLFFNIPSHDQEGMCAALLTYTLFECKAIRHLQELCLIVNDYDLWIKKDPRSNKLNILFQMYWERMADAFIDGRTEFTKEEEKFILNAENEFNKVYKSIEYFDLDEFSSVPAVFFVCNDYVNECCEQTFKDYSTIKICFAYSTKSSTLSVRSNLSTVHVGKIISDLQYGGGHKSAAGIRTNNCEMPELLEIIKKVMTKIVEEHNKMV